MRLVMCALFSIASNAVVFGQTFLFPKESNIYADSFAVQLAVKPNDLKKPRLFVETVYADRFYEAEATDSILIVPYYLPFDKEHVLIARTEGGKTKRLFVNAVKLFPITRNDSIESAMLRVMENPSEKNLLTLAKTFEESGCYGNALYVHYKLYRLGFRNYWAAFTKRHFGKREVVDPVLR